MKNELTIGNLIKRHIKMRGREVKDVALSLGKNYKTFSGILNRDAVDAKLLFELANLLDIDLVWMAQLFDRKKSVSSLAPYQMPRMQSCLRTHDYPNVISKLDFCIKNNPDSIADARKELLSFIPNMFYLLDVLLPEEDIIRITVERGAERFYCIPGGKSSYETQRQQRSIQQIYSGIEMLNQIIQERKETLL